MADLQTLRATLVRRKELETELAELSIQEGPLARDVQRLKIEVNNKQFDMEKLSRPGLRSLVLGWTGKKEAALSQAVRDTRAAKDHLNTVSFRLETLQTRIAALSGELEQLSSCEADYLAQLYILRPGDERLAAAESLLQQLQLGESLRRDLREAADALLPLLRALERLYETGDIQTDLVGRPYDNKFPAMRDRAIPCQAALNRFTALLSQYEVLCNLTFEAAVPGPWSAEENYLTAPAFDAQELFERLENVQFWLQRLKRVGTSMMPQQAAIEQTWRQELRTALFALHDSL